MRTLRVSTACTLLECPPVVMHRLLHVRLCFFECVGSVGHCSHCSLLLLNLAAMLLLVVGHVLYVTLQSLL